MLQNRSIFFASSRSDRSPVSVFTFLLAILLLPPSQIHAATLRCTLDRNTVALGESVTLALTFEGGAPEGTPQIPALQNLTVAFANDGRQVSIINGQVTQSRTFTYILTPQVVGEFTIPPFQALIDGKPVVSQPLKFTVVKPTASVGSPGGPNQYAFVRLTVPKNEIYLGEVLPIEVRLYYLNAEQVQIPQLKADGFTVGPTPQPRQGTEQVGRNVYNVVQLLTSATAARTGELTLGPAETSLVLRIRPANRRQRDPFDPFGFDAFDSFFGNYERRPATLQSDVATIRVLPLPTNNVPPAFNGAVGEYLMTVEPSASKVVAGDPITIKVQISGRGALDALPAPVMQWKDFKIYPPTSKIETSDPQGLQGTKTFEIVVVPETSALREIPAIEFAYFDPTQRLYRQLRHAPTPLTVTPGSSTPQPTIMATPSPRETALNKDIVHIKPYLGEPILATQPWVLRPWFPFAAILPWLGLIMAWWFRRSRESLEKNPRLLRQRTVRKMIAEGLPALAQEANQRDAAAFFARFFRLLQEQLGERLNLPPSAITEAVIDDQLPARGAPPQLIGELHALFQICNQARYAPTGTSEELQALIPRLNGAMESLRALPDAPLSKPAPATAANRLPLLFALCMFPACQLQAASPAGLRIDFESANRLYEQGQFKEAIAAYQQLLTQKRTPALLFNLANAFFRSGQPGQALVHYRLAQQLDPRDPDIRANLAFARSAVQGSPATLPFHQRVLGQLTLNEWTFLCLAASSAWAALLILRQCRSSLVRLLRGYTATAGLIALLLAATLLLTASDRLARQEAVVTQPEAVVRFGPLPESQTAFVLRDGIEVRILDSKGPYYQVMDSNQRIGWAATNAVTLLPHY